MSDHKETKEPKTYDEAINELQAFIIKSKKEEAKKQEQEARKAPVES